jgi:hypothetical protein
MSEREQPIVRVLAIQDVVVPVAVEAAAVGPQGIDEIEARLLECRDVGVEPDQRVDRRGGREQVGDRRPGERTEAALRMRLRQQPRREGVGDRLAELAQRRGCGRRPPW